MFGLTLNHLEAARITALHISRNEFKRNGFIEAFGTRSYKNKLSKEITEENHKCKFCKYFKGAGND